MELLLQQQGLGTRRSRHRTNLRYRALKRLGSNSTENPDGCEWQSFEQGRHLKRVRDISVKTLVSNSYGDIIIFLQEHSKQVRQRGSLDFSGNGNPNDWLNKFMHNDNLLKQCEHRHGSPAAVEASKPGDSTSTDSPS